MRLQAFGVTEPTTGSDTTKLKTRAVRKGNDEYVVNGQKVWTSRALHSDLMLLLARTTPIEEVKKRSEGLSVFLVDIRESRGKGMDIRPLKAMVNHNTTEVFFDNLEVPAENLIGEEGKGLALHHGRHERRAHPRCLGGGRRRPLVPQEGDRLREFARRVRPHRSARTRACSFRSRAPTRSSRPPT